MTKVVLLGLIINIVNTNSKGQSPSWETNSRSASQEIPRLLWNPKVHYCVHSSPQLVPVLSQFSSIHTLTFCFVKPLILGPSTHLHLRMETIICSISHLYHACYMLRPSHLPWLDKPNTIWWSVQIVKLLIMQPPALLPFQVQIPTHYPQSPVLRRSLR
jgi:hypothetical protein